jgi:hypothetical protein
MSNKPIAKAGTGVAGTDLGVSVTSTLDSKPAETETGSETLLYPACETSRRYSPPGKERTNEPTPE